MTVVPIRDQIDEAENHVMGLGHQAEQLTKRKAPPEQVARVRERQTISRGILATLRDVQAMRAPALRATTRLGGIPEHRT